MTLNAAGILAAAVSHAQASGCFERVNGHEPKNAPGNGLTAAVWVEALTPVRTSGLNSTSVLVTLNVRCYSNMLQEPQDAIDPNLLTAVDALMAAYSGDFELGGTARHVDLLGAYSPGLSAKAGYLQQDGATYRVMTITVPLVLNDLWNQTP